MTVNRPAALRTLQWCHGPMQRLHWIPQCRNTSTNPPASRVFGNLNTNKQTNQPTPNPCKATRPKSTPADRSLAGTLLYTLSTKSSCPKPTMKRSNNNFRCVFLLPKANIIIKGDGSKMTSTADLCTFIMLLLEEKKERMYISTLIKDSLSLVR